MSRKLNRIGLATVLAAALSLASVAAIAADASGVWLRDTGASKVKIAACGAALCGHIVWLKDAATSPAKLGEKIFFDMKPDGDNYWAGSAYNPEDGKTYTGKMALSGNTLTTKGCVFGGLVCKSVTWSRSN